MGGAAKLASALCLGKYEQVAFDVAKWHTPRRRLREGRLRTPVVYKAGHQGNLRWTMETYIHIMDRARTSLWATIVDRYGD